VLREKERRAIIELRDRRDPDPGELREIRRAAGVSVSELADVLGVGRSTVYEWESNEKRPWPRHRARWYAAIELLRGGDDAESP
jgi:DNA-binding transcriptional regulator YiaG